MGDLTKETVRYWTGVFGLGPDVDGSCRQCNAQMVLGPMAEATTLCHDCAQMFIADCAESLLDMAGRAVSEETVRLFGEKDYGAWRVAIAAEMSAMAEAASALREEGTGKA